MAKKKFVEESKDEETTVPEEIKAPDEIHSLEDVDVYDVEITESVSVPIADMPKKREKIAVFMNNFSHVVYAGPDEHHRQLSTFRRGQIIFDESLIDDLLKMDAPIRVYYRDVD